MAKLAPKMAKLLATMAKSASKMAKSPPKMAKLPTKKANLASKMACVVRRQVSSTRCPSAVACSARTHTPARAPAASAALVALACAR